MEFDSQTSINLWNSIGVVQHYRPHHLEIFFKEQFQSVNHNLFWCWHQVSTTTITKKYDQLFNNRNQLKIENQMNENYKLVPTKFDQSYRMSFFYLFIQRTRSKKSSTQYNVNFFLVNTHIIFGTKSICQPNHIEIKVLVCSFKNCLRICKSNSRALH